MSVDNGVGLTGNPELAARIHRPEVVSGRWTTQYHGNFGWLPFDSFPEQYRGMFQAGMSVVNIWPRWKPEAWRPVSDEGLTFMEAVCFAQGSPPIKIPLFGQHHLDLPSVFYGELRKSLQMLPDRNTNYKPGWRLNFPHVRPIPQDPTLPPEDYAEFNNVILHPFPYYRVRPPFKIVSDDPYRFILTMIGVPRPLLEWAKQVGELTKAKYAEMKTSGFGEIEYDLPPIPAGE